MIEEHRNDFEKVVEYCKKNISVLRTGRASANLLDDVMVDVYGAPTPLAHLATVSAPEARLITVSPWDKANFKAIEDAINKADLNLNPVNDGQLIRLNIPALTEETRKEFVKQLGTKLEEAKVHIRQIREKIREEVNQAEKDKEISQDDKYSFFEKADKITSDYISKIEEIGKEKEKEIMTI